MLSALLRQAEGMVEHDGRNEMLAKLAGHYAKAFHVEEMYREQCRVVNERVFGEPVDDEEFDKTVTSIWQREQAKGATVVHGADGEPLRVGEATQDNGWLISAKTRLLTEVTRKDEDGEKTTELEQWADFDIRCLGIVDDPPHTPRSYFVEIHRANERVIPDVLKATTLADTRSTVAWFLDRGCSILPPDGSKHRQAPGPRLAAYLNSQGAPMFEVVDSLGFHREAGGFVTLEGVITHDGPTGYTSHVPDPVIRKRVDYRYGFDGTMEDARWVLNEVLTFHKTIEAAVFGSWWAACLLKPMFEDMSSLFPFMALEAPSESGKTTGMFALLIELAGNARGQTLSTRPAFRDAVASHRSGIAWIDDADDIGNLEELLRAITGGGTTAKMAEDRESLAVVKLQAPVLLTGEALNIGDQKALRDRAILLEVRSPTDQKSTRDRTKSQWEDIVALRDRFPKDQGGLTRISGHVVRMALEQAYRVEDFMSLRGAEGKRHGDKVAVLRTGARVLAGMTGRSGWIDAVDHWLDELPDYEAQANSLTLRTLPDLWSRDGFPRTPSESRRWGSPAPVYVREDGIVCFRPIGCAQALVDLRHGRVDQRTETQGAIEGQARQMGARARAVNARVGSDRIRYWTLPAELSASVIRVAQA